MNSGSCNSASVARRRQRSSGRFGSPGATWSPGPDCLHALGGLSIVVIAEPISAARYVLARERGRYYEGAQSRAQFLSAGGLPVESLYARQ